MADRPDIDRLAGVRLAAELWKALDDPHRYEWGADPWEHMGDAERDVRVLLTTLDDLVALARRERDARKAVEKVKADEVLAKRTNLEALIASETARAEAAEARVAELEQYRAEWEDEATHWHQETVELEQRAANLEAALRDVKGEIIERGRPRVDWHPLVEKIDATLAGDGGGA